MVEVDGITAAIARLRRSQANILAPMPQAGIIKSLTEWAELWRDPAYPPRLEAEAWQEPFPFAMVRVSLDALLDSLTPEALWALVEAEDVRDARGHPVIGHVIAGNTPLLAWVSIIRALLVGSTSFVKLPSGPAAEWGRLFVRTLADVSADLATCVHLDQWPGGTAERDATLCGGVDLVMAHGGDTTMRSLRALSPPHIPFVGYGHRVSFGLVTRGSGEAQAAEGLAKDVLLYDQGGCLSPQTIFVEGDWQDVLAFAERLAAALPDAVAHYPLPTRAGGAEAAVREARELGWMGEGNRLWEDPGLRWTVIARPQAAFAPLADLRRRIRPATCRPRRPAGSLNGRRGVLAGLRRGGRGRGLHPRRLLSLQAGRTPGPAAVVAAGRAGRAPRLNPDAALQG